jgi:hypothetical protein
VVQVKPKKAKTTRSASTDNEPMAMEDDFYPVQCSECSTVVAMQDLDEVYHFFNIIASEP